MKMAQLLNSIVVDREENGEVNVMFVWRPMTILN